MDWNGDGKHNHKDDSIYNNVINKRSTAVNKAKKHRPASKPAGR